MKFKRILLKLSGESLAGKTGTGIDSAVTALYAKQIAEVAGTGVQIAIVIGGGNIFRGLSGVDKGFSRVKGDQMGIVEAEVFTSMAMEPVARHYAKEKAVALMEKGGIAIIAGGTGNPYFTTDSAAALRACEIEADALLKGTRVDGIYTADPEKDPAARKFKTITFSKVYELGLKIMDLTAFTLCKENNCPIIVFDMDKEGNLERLVVKGEEIGTTVENN